MSSKSAKAIVEDYKRRQAAIQAEAAPEPFLDHKVYPQGWTYAMIERQAARRYQSVRDVERKQDWIWAVDDPAVWPRMTQEARRAARELYELQQTAMGDVERIEQPRIVVDGGFQYLGASWAQTRAAVIADNAKRHVRAHPQLTAARLRVFEALFDVHQPTLTEIRFSGAYNAKGKPIYLNQGQVVRRIVWCCEALADVEAGLDANYGRAA